jgi:hypothetical protein
MRAHIFIDYDNVPLRLRSPGLRSLAGRLRLVTLARYPSITQLDLRLYGGWYDDQGLTREGTRLTQEIFGNFPDVISIGGRIRLRVNASIASAPINTPGDLLGHTFRERGGIRSRLRFIPSNRCLNPQTCNAPLLARWSRGSCPTSGCGVQAREVFTYHEQKLVDTLLCCDLLSIVFTAPNEPVFLLSDDDDMVPAILLRANLGAPTHKIEIQPARTSRYQNVLLQRGVNFDAL